MRGSSVIVAISHAMWRLASARTSPLWPQPEVHANAVPGKPQPHLFFDATIQPAPPVAPPPATATAGGGALTSLEYVSKHELAPLLNTAINEVARVQPADPVAWLSEWLAKQPKK